MCLAHSEPILTTPDVFNELFLEKKKKTEVPIQHIQWNCQATFQFCTVFVLHLTPLAQVPYSGVLCSLQADLCFFELWASSVIVLPDWSFQSCKKLFVGFGPWEKKACTDFRLSWITETFVMFVWFCSRNRGIRRLIVNSIVSNATEQATVSFPIFNSDTQKANL